MWKISILSIFCHIREKMNKNIKSIAIGESKKYNISGKIFKSAYKKDIFLNSADVTSLGLVGDYQVDKKYHGGLDGAIHMGSYTHIEKNPNFDKLFIGCNILIEELDEDEVCIGDIYSIGETKLQVCQPRFPCWKIGALFGKEPSRYISRNYATGWYLRVLKEGTIKIEDSLILEKRVSNITIKDMISYLKKPPKDEVIEELISSDFVANAYKNDLLKVLKKVN